MTIKKRHWTPAEDAVMLADYIKFGTLAIERKLEGRSCTAIQQRAVTLGIAGVKGEPWTADEDAMLAKLWPAMGAKCCIHFPNRAKTAVQTRARRLRLQSVLARKPREKKIAEPAIYRRKGKGSYGYIPGGPVASVFNLASAIGGNK